MAIIRCPECGHQISDRAPVCPSCGVEIADKITSCPQCGNTYFNDLQHCPKCHHTNMNYQNHATHQTYNDTTATPPPPATTLSPESSRQSKSNKRSTVLIMAFIFALLACSTGYYFYHHAQDSQEQEAYEFALQSKDPIVLQDYLDRFKEASSEHRGTIESHLKAIQQIDNEWTNAVVSNSKTALEDYLEKYPDSPRRAEAMRKIDSLDWVAVSTANRLDAFQSYLEDHPNGAYVDDAKNGIKRINAQTVQPEERAMISSLFKQFFHCITTKDEEGLINTVSPLLTSFLGKVDANKNDVVTFMNKLYHAEVVSMNWYLLNDYKIEKKEIGDEEYEYTINFSADQDVSKVDETEQTSHYRIKAKVNPDGKITEFNMTRIIQ